MQMNMHVQMKLQARARGMIVRSKAGRRFRSAGLHAMLTTIKEIAPTSSDRRRLESARLREEEEVERKRKADEEAERARELAREQFEAAQRVQAAEHTRQMARQMRASIRLQKALRARKARELAKSKKMYRKLRRPDPLDLALLEGKGQQMLSYMQQGKQQKVGVDEIMARNLQALEEAQQAAERAASQAKEAAMAARRAAMAAAPSPNLSA